MTVLTTLKAKSIEEQMMILFCSMCSLQGEHEQWSMSERLKATIEQYSRAMILAPDISAYRGTLDIQVLGAMRALGVKGLPQTHDSDNLKLLLKEISHVLTAFRSTVKGLISQSRSNSSGTRNLASLVNALIRNTQVPPTLQLYRRVAFLVIVHLPSMFWPHANKAFQRWLMDTYPQSTTSEWWIKVDEKLAKTYQGLDPEQIDRLFTQVYKDDVAKFGDPSEIESQIVEPAALPGWIQVINQYATSVVSQKSRSNKRKLAPE
ncbi:hypothetical protein H1R20_g1888, partial [Candolleomyces eurysporus]